MYALREKLLVIIPHFNIRKAKFSDPSVYQTCIEVPGRSQNCIKHSLSIWGTSQLIKKKKMKTNNSVNKVEGGSSARVVAQLKGVWLFKEKELLWILHSQVTRKAFIKKSNLNYTLSRVWCTRVCAHVRARVCVHAFLLSLIDIFCLPFKFRLNLLSIGRMTWLNYSREFSHALCWVWLDNGSPWAKSEGLGGGGQSTYFPGSCTEWLSQTDNIPELFKNNPLHTTLPSKC